jgi:hypothetical protein
MALSGLLLTIFAMRSLNILGRRFASLDGVRTVKVQKAFDNKKGKK